MLSGMGRIGQGETQAGNLVKEHGRALQRSSIRLKLVMTFEFGLCPNLRQVVDIQCSLAACDRVNLMGKSQASRFAQYFKKSNLLIDLEATRNP